MHSGYGIGALLAPVIATPFLGNEHMDHLNNSTVNDQPDRTEEEINARMDIFWTILSTIIFAFSLGYLVFVCIDRNKIRADKDKSECEENAVTVTIDRIRQVTLVGLMSLLIMVQAGMEVSCPLYLSTYSQKSALEFTPVEGAEITSIYTGAFALSRVVAIFISIRVNPFWTMVVSLGTLLTGSLAMIFLARTKVLAFQVCFNIISEFAK